MATGLILGALGLGAGVCALIGFAVLSVVLCCLWKRGQRDLATIKRCTEKDIPASVAMTSNHNVNAVQTLRLPSPSRQRSSSPSLPRCIITDAPMGYSSVNMISLLPDEVRTPENLEGKVIPLDKEGQLLERYTKDMAGYEDRQLHKCEEMKTCRGSAQTHLRPAASASLLSTSLPLPIPSAINHSNSNFDATFEDSTFALYDSVEHPSQISTKGDFRQTDLAMHQQPTGALLFPAHHPVTNQPDMEVYGQPADALVIPIRHPVAKKVPERPKNKIMVEISDIGQAYSPVFSPLQAKEAELVGPMRPTRVMSSSSLREKYDNNGMAVQRSQKERHVARTDSRRASYNRRAAKEEVELDPHKQHVFRMTSQKKKEGRRGGDQVEGVRVSKNLDSPSGSQEGVRMELEESTGELGEVQDRMVTGVSYAMVNMADKKSNRVESDAIKCEGSGVPYHFVVPVPS